MMDEQKRQEELQALKRDIFESLHCALPGKVVSFDIQEGDACLVIFADRDIDSWFETGEAEVPPSGRMHSLSDGFAFVGFRTRRNVDEDASDG